MFPISEEPLKRALAAAGDAAVRGPGRDRRRVASYDRGFDYRKLQIAFDAIWFHKRAA